MYSPSPCWYPIHMDDLPTTSQAWVKSTIDIFHDYQLPLEGLPDLTSRSTFVRQHQNSMTLAAPVGATTWDLRVIFTGLDCQYGDDYGAMRAFCSGNFQECLYDSSSFPANGYLNSLVAIAAPSGTYPKFSSVGTSGTYAQGLVSRNLSVPGRMIGTGFEMHDSSAQVYKQGMITCAAIPGAGFDCNVMATDANSSLSGVVYDSTVRRLVGPFPISEAQVKAIPGAGTWEAAKGCYVIPRLEDSQVPFAPSITGVPVGLFENSYTGASTQDCVHTIGGSSLTTTLPFVRQGCPVSRFQPCVAYMSGLASTSVITITFRNNQEYTPSPFDGEISAARPSAPYDPRAFEIYSIAAVRAPTCVPVGFNDAGKYFRMVTETLEKAARAVTPIVTMIPKYGPVIGAGTSAVGTIAGLAGQLVPVQQKKKKKKPAAKAVNRTVAGAPAMTTRRR